MYHAATRPRACPYTRTAYQPTRQLGPKTQGKSDGAPAKDLTQRPDVKCFTFTGAKSSPIMLELQRILHGSKGSGPECEKFLQNPLFAAKWTMGHRDIINHLNAPSQITATMALVEEMGGCTGCTGESGGAMAAMITLDIPLSVGGAEVARRLTEHRHGERLVLQAADALLNQYLLITSGQKSGLQGCLQVRYRDDGSFCAVDCTIRANTGFEWRGGLGQIWAELLVLLSGQRWAASRRLSDHRGIAHMTTAVEHPDRTVKHPLLLPFWNLLLTYHVEASMMDRGGVVVMMGYPPELTRAIGVMCEGDAPQNVAKLRAVALGSGVISQHWVSFTKLKCFPHGAHWSLLDNGQYDLATLTFDQTRDMLRAEHNAFRQAKGLPPQPTRESMFQEKVNEQQGRAAQIKLYQYQKQAAASLPPMQPIPQMEQREHVVDVTKKMVTLAVAPQTTGPRYITDLLMDGIEDVSDDEDLGLDGAVFARAGNCTSSGGLCEIAEPQIMLEFDV
nr:hypothetical protein [Salmonid herpesvirus 1]